MQKVSQKKTSKKQNKDVPVDTPLDTSTDAPVDVPVADAPSDAATAPNDKKKLPPSIGNIHISRARCEWHFRGFISDNAIEQQIKNLKELQKETTDEDALKANKTKIDELNKNLIRISQYTPHAIAIVSDSVVKDIIRYGITQLLNSGKKSLDISYFYTNGIQELNLYPLFKSLSSYVEGSKRVEEPTKKKVSKKKGEETEDEEVNAAESGADTDAGAETDTEGTSMSFNTYINNAILEVKKSFDVKITIGTKVKKYLSDLLIELIKRIALITKSLIRNIINVRTIAPNHIKAVISLLLLDGNVSESAADEVLVFIDEKIKVFQQAAIKVEGKPAEGAAEGAAVDAAEGAAVDAPAV